MTQASKDRILIIIMIFFTLCQLLFCKNDTNKLSKESHLNSKNEVLDNNKIDGCKAPKFVLKSIDDTIKMIYQFKNCKIDTFNMGWDLSVGELKTALKSQFKIDWKSNFTDWLKKQRKVNYSNREDKNLSDMTVLDSFTVFSRDVLIFTDSIVEHIDWDDKNFRKSFDYELSFFLLKKGDEFLQGSGKQKFFSTFDVFMIKPEYTYYHKVKLGNLDEEEYIRTYLNSLGVVKDSSNSNFLIVGNDNLTLKELNIKNFSIVQYFTINFGLIYPSSS